jgi:polar amino acid transport system substrate-binding protein
MKKVIGLFLIRILAVGVLAACGETKDANEDDKKLVKVV